MLSTLAHAPYTVLLDLTCPDALSTIRAIRSRNPDAVIVVLADESMRDRMANAVREGIVEVASKPIVASDLLRALTAARRLRALSPASLLAVKDPVFVRSAPMRAAVDVAWRAALSSSPTLIVGEPATGREFLARTIHRVAGQDDRSFVKIDCADLAPADVEHQLFGFGPEGPPMGGYNGQRITPWSGLYRAARGTLFFKHFAAMSPTGRAVVARALRIRQASVDGRRSLDLKIRVIVAAGPSAGDQRAFGDLCTDMPFIRLHVPSLRDRREDMSLLASHFVEQIARSQGLSPKILTATAHELLAALPWRGNAGELRNLLETLVSRVPGRLIRLEDILPHLRVTFRSAGGDETLREARSVFERDYIIGALERNAGRIADTADALGVLRPNLHRTMRRLGIVRASGPASIALADIPAARETRTTKRITAINDVTEQERL